MSRRLKQGKVQAWCSDCQCLLSVGKCWQAGLSGTAQMAKVKDEAKAGPGPGQAGHDVVWPAWAGRLGQGKGWWQG